MTEPIRSGTTRTSRLIKAPREAIYRACTDPHSLATWRAPGEMTAEVHAWDLRVGGGYTMSLYYPLSEPDDRGKTAGREDRFRSRFLDLTPGTRIVEAITFETDNPAFAGELTMTVTLADHADGTEVTITFETLPPGIRPEDNEAGTRASLEKLARLVAARPS